MDYNFMPAYAKSLLSDAQSKHSIFTDEFVVKVFSKAEKAHRGQKRAGGHPYLHHCVETAVMLANIGASTTVVCAGLLHDVVDDSFLTFGHITRCFGDVVSDLVEGVSKLSRLSKLARKNDTASKTEEAYQLHTAFLAMADVRAVLIKLADRLHNMSTLEALPFTKQKRFAKETIEIFAPLANRLGLAAWKEQLQNLCFPYLYPGHQLDLSYFDEGVVTSCLETLQEAVKEAGISYHSASGRTKSFYSIYAKMSNKKLNIDEIHDIHGLRLLVETEDDCYKALRVVRHIWDEVPGRFKDYIIHPKCDGYRSLHTVVTAKDTKVHLEVQIRTREMHVQIESGYWRYKEGESPYSSFVLQIVGWARWVIAWQCEAMSIDTSSVSFLDPMKPPPCTHSRDCPFSLKPHCGADAPVFVIVIKNDNMFVQECAANSTVLDLLENTSRGSSASRGNSYRFPVKKKLRPRLNSRPVTDPHSVLKIGDVVELSPAIPDN